MFDTHWFTTFEFVVTSHDRRTGKYTSDELPRGMSQVPYDFPGDPELAKLMGEEGTAAGTWITPIDDPCLPIHYATTNLLPFLQGDERWITVSTPQTGETDDFLLAGEAIGRAIERSGRRVVLLASGALSHKFWPLKALRDHEPSDPSHIITDAHRAADLERLRVDVRGTPRPDHRHDVGVHAVHARGSLRSLPADGRRRSAAATAPRRACSTATTRTPSAPARRTCGSTAPPAAGPPEAAQVAQRSRRVNRLPARLPCTSRSPIASAGTDGRPEVPLTEVAAQLACEVCLLRRLDPLGDRAHAERSAELDGGVDERHPDGRPGRRHHLTVELDLVEGQVPEPLEGGERGAEVVERHVDAELAQRPERPVRGHHVDEIERLGELDGQALRIGAAGRQRLADTVGQTMVGEVVAGEVDRHPEPGGDQHVVLPRCDLTAGGGEHPVVEVLDEAARLGLGDERAGGQHAAVGVRPAHERFETDDDAALEVDDRLVVQRECVVVDRGGEARSSGGTPRVQRGWRGGDVGTRWPPNTMRPRPTDGRASQSRARLCHRRTHPFGPGATHPFG